MEDLEKLSFLCSGGVTIKINPHGGTKAGLYSYVDKLYSEGVICGLAVIDPNEIYEHNSVVHISFDDSVIGHHEVIHYSIEGAAKLALRKF